MVVRLHAFCMSSILCCLSFAQTVDRIDSLNLTPGKTAELRIHGNKLSGPICVWTPFGTFSASAVDPKTQDALIQCAVEVPAGLTPGCYEFRTLSSAGTSDARFVVVDDLPSFPGADLSEDRTAPTSLPTACCVDGHLAPLKSKFFQLSLKQEQSISIEVFARRLDSLLDPVLVLRDSRGNEIDFADDTLGLSGDAFLGFTPKQDDDYLLELRDVEYSGSGGHFFHLRIGQIPLVQGVFPRRTSAGKISVVTEALADFQTSVEFNNPGIQQHQPFALPSTAGSGLGSVEFIAESPGLEVEPNNEKNNATDVAKKRFVAGRIQVPGDVDWYRITTDRKQHLCVTAHTRELGSPADLLLEVYDSKGKKLQQVDDVSEMDAQLSTVLTEAGDYFFSVRELSHGGGSIWTYDLEIDLGGRLELASKVDRLRIPAGGTAVVPVSIKRHGIAEPFPLSFEDLPPGMISSEVIVQPNQKTAFVAIRLAEQPLQTPLNKLQLAGRLSTGLEIPVHFRPDLEKIPKHRQLRPQTGTFISNGPAAQFSVTSAESLVKLPVGGQAKIALKATRSKEWTHPIRVESAILKAELPPGVSVEAVSLEADAGELVLTATKEAMAGRYSISLSCTSKKDKTVIVQPVSTITVEVE